MFCVRGRGQGGRGVHYRCTMWVGHAGKGVQHVGGGRGVLGWTMGMRLGKLRFGGLLFGLWGFRVHPLIDETKFRRGCNSRLVA